MRSRSKSSSRDREYMPLILQSKLNHGTINVNIIKNNVNNSIVQANSQSLLVNNKSIIIFSGI